MPNSSLPADLGAEKSILGGILLDNLTFMDVAELSPDDFSIDSHRKIFRCMAALVEAGKPIDTVTMPAEAMAGKTTCFVDRRLCCLFCLFCSRKRWRARSTPATSISEWL